MVGIHYNYSFKFIKCDQTTHFVLDKRVRNYTEKTIDDYDHLKTYYDIEIQNRKVELTCTIYNNLDNFGASQHYISLQPFFMTIR